jgi:autotransporter-associated beta strand protein
MRYQVFSHRLTRIGGQFVSVACGFLGRASFVRTAVLAMGMAGMPLAHALDILIVNTGAYSGTDTNIAARQVAAGNTTTLLGVGALPTNLSAYDQVWDMGYNAGLGTSYVNSLTSYLQGGGTLFLMGENTGAAAVRNPLITSFLGTVGAGTVTISGSGSGAETIAPQFQVANNSASINFAGSGHFGSVGTGICITSACSAAAWGAGTLANATAGAVISVLDINFLTGGNFNPNFADNLIAYLQQQQQIGAGTPPATDIDSNASAYDASNLGTTVNPAFRGGTLNIDTPTATLSQGFTVDAAGATLQAIGTSATLTGTIADETPGTHGALNVTGTGGLIVLTGANTYTGATTVAPGATLALSGTGSVATSSGVTTNGTFDIAATTAGASIVSLAGSGNVALGSRTLTLTASGGNFSGVIGGTGNVAVAGGTQTLSGTNTFTGVTDIASGASLVLTGAGSVASSNNVAIAGTFDVSGTTGGATVAGLTGNGQVLVGSNALTITHATTTFTGSFNGAGSVNVAGGSLTLAGAQGLGLLGIGNGALVSVNGSLSGGVNVAAGGTLHGSGTIAGPVTVAGTLSPGNSPGVMTVASTVTLAPGATFEAEINGATAGNGAGFHDQLNVVGAGSLFNANGATLAANLLTIGGIGAYTPYVPVLGDNYRIVTAEGGLGATRFAAFVQPAGLATGTRLRVVYNATVSNARIDLRVVPVSFVESVSGRGLNRNALSATGAVDALIATDDAGTASVSQSLIANALLGLPDAALNGVLLGLSGEIHGAMAAAQSLSGLGLQDTVAQHLRLSGNTVRDGVSGWVETSTGDSRSSGDGVSSAVRSSRNQTTIGVDLLQTASTRVGVAGSLSTTQVGSGSNGTGKLEDNLAVVYGEQAFGGWRADAQAGFGTGHSRTQRADPLASLGAPFSTDRITTDAQTRQTFASVGVRLPMQLAGVSLEPFARIGAQRVKRDAVTESGTSPSALSLAELSASGTRTSTGLSITSQAQNPMVSRNTYRATLAVGHDGGEALNPLVSASLAGAPMSITAPEVGRNFVQANAFGTWLITPGAYAYAGLSGEARSQRIEKAVTVGAAIAF